MVLWTEIPKVQVRVAKLRVGQKVKSATLPSKLHIVTGMMSGDISTVLCHFARAQSEINMSCMS